MLAGALTVVLLVAEDAPLASRRACLVAERDQILSERPSLVPSIVAFAVPLGGLVLELVPVLVLGALTIFADWAPGSTLPISLLGPYARGMAVLGAILAVLVAPGAIWFGVTLERFGVATRAAHDVDQRLEELDGGSEAPPPGGLTSGAGGPRRYFLSGPTP